MSRNHPPVPQRECVDHTRHTNYLCSTKAPVHTNGHRDVTPQASCLASICRKFSVTCQAAKKRWQKEWHREATVRLMCEILTAICCFVVQRCNLPKGTIKTASANLWSKSTTLWCESTKPWHLSNGQRLRITHCINLHASHFFQLYYAACIRVYDSRTLMIQWFLQHVQRAPLDEPSQDDIERG